MSQLIYLLISACTCCTGGAACSCQEQGKRSVSALSKPYQQTVSDVPSWGHVSGSAEPAAHEAKIQHGVKAGAVCSQPEERLVLHRKIGQ